METTAFNVAQRFVGLSEIPGHVSNPQILSMLRLDNPTIQDDEVPWCSAFVNYIAWILRLPRSKSLSARSWLTVGEAIPSRHHASVGNDVVILSRGPIPQPGPAMLDAPGHVGFFGGAYLSEDSVWVLGGNQSDKVSLAPFPADRILGIRRLA